VAIKYLNSTHILIVFNEIYYVCAVRVLPFNRAKIGSRLFILYGLFFLMTSNKSENKLGV